jgi:hypothetical protein
MPTFYQDILRLFRDMDIECMRGIDPPVLLANYDWWTETPDGGQSFPNYESAHDAVESGFMPLGGPRWDPESVQLLEQWKDAGFPQGNPD